MYASGQRCVCTRITPPEIRSAGRTSRPLIGRRGSGGGSVRHTDCTRVIGAVDMSPGGVWPVSRCCTSDWVTCLLILFSHRDITWTVSFPRKWTAGGTDWVLQAGYMQLIAEYCNMDAVGSSERGKRLRWNCMSHGTRRRQWWTSPRLVWCLCVTCQML